ncbi:cupin domain-containing protein [Cohnella suwonensis]|uniref:Cupin domain-containing protein n=1 Tax=Cohnella suwonensis TaxID=696072 RepID=A0ABW0LXG9_9BACL
MAVSYIDFTSPNMQFTCDVNKNPAYVKDDRNRINALGVDQLNSLGNASILDIYLSKGNIVEPHIHQNATELVYCVSGGAIVSMINPFAKKLLNYQIGPAQVANVPQGWWHYEIATVDQTHLIAIFDAPAPEFISGSDILRLTPPNVLAYSYGLDEATVKAALSPIKETVVIGPPAGLVPAQAQAHSQRQEPVPQPYPAGHPQPYPAGRQQPAISYSGQPQRLPREYATESYPGLGYPGTSYDGRTPSPR